MLRRGVGVPLGPGRLRRVRRAGHHVDGVLLPAPGRAGVDQARGSRPRRPPGAPGRRCGPARRGRCPRRPARRRSPGRPPGRRTAGTTGPARSAARPRPAGRTPLSLMLSTRTTSRLASVCPSASIRVFSRARIRSPAAGLVPVRQRDLSLADLAELDQPLADQARTAGPRSRSTWPSAGPPGRPGSRSGTAMTASSYTRSCGPW